mmetsp:Transcript_20564/g.20683  ORF Transcript_20564/g.20683 Transcript_20564/m.20683 type:complete len:836 (+) Transcript_20564:269-2776(+)
MKRNMPYSHIKGRKNNHFSMLTCLFGCLFFMIIAGFFLCVQMIISSPQMDGKVKSLQSDPQTIKDKVLNMIPSIKAMENYHMDWRADFWTPIAINIDPNPDSDPDVSLCRLDFVSYSNAPHMFATFRQLVAQSGCDTTNRKQESLSSLKEKMRESNKESGKPRNPPSGFIFHESRVGSTLVSNMLGSDPSSMVFSEADPPSTVLMHCPECTRERQIRIFRDIVYVMGTSSVHKRYFFKFQSIDTTMMSIVLEAFPTVPWIFLYRNSIQTMVSHLDNELGTGWQPECLQSKRDQNSEVTHVISKYSSEAGSDSEEAWCAAHLNYLCTSALSGLQTYGHYSTGQGGRRGMLVNYETLPGIIPSVVVPRLFDITVTDSWLNRMRTQSTLYSKSGDLPASFLMTTNSFMGDSRLKDSHATEKIKQWADTILGPTYSLMEKAARQAMKDLSPELGSNWKSIAMIPLTAVSSNSEKLRQKLDLELQTKDLSSSKNMVSLLKTADFSPWNPFAVKHSSKPYERVECPAVPPKDYPKAYPVMDLLNNWNADNTDIPAFHYDSLCHFDYKTEYNKALAYRKAEKPFIVYNFPELDSAVKRWGDLDYLRKKIGTRKYRTETSKDNHFMYFRNVRNPRSFRGKDGKAWEEPTKEVMKTFDEFLETAIAGQNQTLEEREHLYFRVTAMSPGRNEPNSWVFDELPFFQPKESLFIVDPEEQRGVHCRFGMKAVIAEPHYDGSRNSVAMLGGLRRWVMTHPDQCGNMYLLPKRHPSGRHSEVDWSAPDLERFPDFPKVRANEVILKPGDILYVPTQWFHFIVSLNLNYQCNSRSGISHGYDKFIHDCGF